MTQDVKDKLASIEDKGSYWPHYNQIYIWPPIVKSKQALLTLKQTLVHEDNILKQEDHRENLNRILVNQRYWKDLLLDKHMAKLKLVDNIKRQQLRREKLQQLKRKSQV